MRDSYQTVLAKEVRALLNPEASSPTTTAAHSAHVFEIAPGRAIELHIRNDNSWRTHSGNFVLRHFTMLSIFVFVLALANAFLILKAIATRKAHEDPDYPEIVRAPMKPWARIFVYAEVVVPFLGILFLLCWATLTDATILFGEPLALGVSIWPSVMIRLLAFMVAILFLLIASYSFVAYGHCLKKDLQAALPTKLALPLPEGLARESARLCHEVILESASISHEQTYDTQLEKLLNPHARIKRIVWFSIVYITISSVLFQIWPPSVPARGAFALLTEKIVLSLGVSLYIIHLIFCLDLHVGAFNFLRSLRSLYSPAVKQKIRETGAHIDAKLMLCATSALTSIIGKTLLYPLTVLILIVLSRLRIFDNWVMTPSLTMTFADGALLLVAASLVLWVEGSRLKKDVLAEHNATGGIEPDAAFAKRKEDLSAIDDGVFAAWYNQPIFAAIFSAAAVFGSLSAAGPLARLFFSYS